MPYYLNNASANDAAIQIPQVAIGTNVGDYIEFKAVANAGNSIYVMCGRSDTTSDNNKLVLQPSSVLLRASSFSNTLFATGYTQPPVGSVFVIRLTKTGPLSWSVTLNGSSIGTGSSGATLTITAIGRRVQAATDCFIGGFYYVAISTNGGASATRYYDPSNTSSGTVLPDTLNSANNGNQIGTWPTNDSEWVFYSSGGAYTLTADGATFSYSGGIASTIYNRLLSADGGSFNYSGGVAATLLNRSIAADGATFGYSGGVSALLYGRALQASGGSFSYSGGVATFVYTPITGYVLNADGGIFSYAGGEAALSFNQNYPTANPNDYTVSAYLSTDSTYTARLSESSIINAIISTETTYAARLN